MHAGTYMYILIHLDLFYHMYTYKFFLINEMFQILQSMEIEENQKNVESKQNADDKESKEILKKHADHDEDALQNWNAIVEKELGETAGM